MPLCWRCRSLRAWGGLFIFWCAGRHRFGGGGRRSLGRRRLMDGFPQLIQLLVHFDLGFIGRSLRGVDRVAEQITGSTNALRIHSLFEFDALDFQEVAETLEQFVLFDRFHNLV